MCPVPARVGRRCKQIAPVGRDQANAPKPDRRESSSIRGFAFGDGSSVTIVHLQVTLSRVSGRRAQRDKVEHHIQIPAFPDGSTWRFPLTSPILPVIRITLVSRPTPEWETNPRIII